MQCSRCHHPATQRCEKRCGFVSCGICGKKGHSHDTESAENRVLFDAFYDENGGRRLFMRKTFPLNSDQLKAWEFDMENSANPTEIIQFSKTFVQHLRHVSFSEFENRLFKVAQSITEKIKRADVTKVYLLIDGGLDKSNTWVALLCWSFLREVVTDVVNRAVDIPNEDWREGCAVIHPDDMSYSGTQMAEVIDRIPKKYLDIDSNYYMLIPYIGSAAKARLAKASSNLRFSKATKVIPTLKEYLELDGYDSDKIIAMLEDRQQPWALRYGARGTYNLIYFDHKLADALSIPNKMLAALYVFDTEGKVKSTYHPIRGCEDAVYKDKWTGEDLGPNLQVMDYDAKATCPMAFYKSIPYKFKNVEIKQRGMKLLDLLRSMSDE
jgi:hypothetical protein